MKNLNRFLYSSAGSKISRVILRSPSVRLVPTIGRVVVGRSWDFTSELLKSLTLGFRDEERGEETAEHEQREDLHDVVEPWRSSASSSSWEGATSS